jgi:tripartite-type tricarboxylate transporter receptor subunit TctC
MTNQHLRMRTDSTNTFDPSESNRRMRKLIVAAMLASGLTAGSAQAQPYPARTVTVVVPIAAGGAVDTTARIFAEQLQAKLGQYFIVGNCPGC